MSQPTFVEIYEQTLVPALFGPWARDLVERARPAATDRVLDLGSGTGIVGRVVRERVGAATRIAAIDLNPQMIALGRAIAPDLDWHQGDAMRLPFPPGSFDLVLSQAMLQFVPDRAAAMREARRVLADRGRVVVSTWGTLEENPLYLELDRINARHLGPVSDRRYAFGDPAALRDLLVDAGFADVAVETVQHTVRFPAGFVRLNALAIHSELSTMSDDEREQVLARIERDSEPVLARFTDDRGVGSPMTAQVASGRVGEP